MFRDKKITLVIPSYNECEGIKFVLQRIASFIDEILVVDSSQDNTAEIARGMGATVIREERRGYGRAYKTGFLNVKGDIVVTTDADGTYPIDEKELPRILNFFIDNNLDFLNASRFPMKFSKEIMPYRRIFGNKFLTFMSNVLFRGGFRDILSGMWIFKRDVPSKLKLIDDTWSFSEEIKIESFMNKTIKFGEMHIPYKVRVGTSKLIEKIYYPYKIGLHNLFFMFKMKLHKHLFFNLPADII